MSRNRHLFRVLTGIPLLMAFIAFAVISTGSWVVPTAVLLGGWGLIATCAPVGWFTWLARMLPEDAEAGGGLMVAVIQLAITVGATLGRVLYDGVGYQATFQWNDALGSDCLDHEGRAASIGYKCAP